MIKVIFALSLISNLAWADLRCDRDDFIYRRVANLMDLNQGQPWPANKDPIVKAMKSDDSCWAPDRFGWSLEDVTLVESIRLNNSLLKQLQDIGQSSSTQDPTLSIANVKSVHPELDWNSKPLQKWIESTRSRWGMVTEINQPEACNYKRIDVGPVREQWNPWCIGMVATDMLSNASGSFLSASDLALQMNLRVNNFKVEVGYPVSQPLFHGSLGATIKPGVFLPGSDCRANFGSAK